MSRPAMEKTRESKKTFREAAKELAKKLGDSIAERVKGHERVAVSFSGGLDSSIVAHVASRIRPVVLCSAFAAGSRDEVQADRAAGLLGLPLRTAVIDEHRAATLAKEAELPPGEATLMDKALWCIYSTTSRLAGEGNAQMIMLGQLADELFGGYKKYAIAAAQEGPLAAERMMRADILSCADRGFLRDEAACSSRAEVRFPFADKKIASFARSLPLAYKIKGNERKAVLRAAALELGLPDELAQAPKKAAQFSSGIAKLLKRA